MNAYTQTELNYIIELLRLTNNIASLLKNESFTAAMKDTYGIDTLHILKHYIESIDYNGLLKRLEADYERLTKSNAELFGDKLHTYFVLVNVSIGLLHESVNVIVTCTPDQIKEAIRKQVKEEGGEEVEFKGILNIVKLS